MIIIYLVFLDFQETLIFKLTKYKLNGITKNRLTGILAHGKVKYVEEDAHICEEEKIC